MLSVLRMGYIIHLLVYNLNIPELDVSNFELFVNIDSKGNLIQKINFIQVKEKELKFITKKQAFKNAETLWSNHIDSILI